jgi:hypothetical protein
VEGEAPLRRVIPRGLATYRDNWAAIASVTALVLMPAAVVQGLVIGLADDELDSGLAIGFLAATAVAVSGLGYFFLKGVITQIVVAHRHDRDRPSLAEIARSLPYATLIVVDLVLATGVTIGLDLLIVPGVVFGTWFALAPIVVETEHVGVRAAFRRSRELVHGNFWEVLTVLFLTLALVAALHWPLEEIVGGLAGGLSEEVSTGIAYLLAGILVKPVGAVITIELTLELAAARSGGAAR